MIVDIVTSFFSGAYHRVTEAGEFIVDRAGEFAEFAFGLVARLSIPQIILSLAEAASQAKVLVTAFVSRALTHQRFDGDGFIDPGRCAA